MLGCKSVAFDEHALIRMGERGDTESEVFELDPTQVIVITVIA